MESRSNADAIECYSFLVMFANDGLIDAAELAFCEKLALADGVVDDDERDVLRRIFSRVDPARLAPQVRDEIASFRARYGI
ncbi:MAG: hypothetical protein H6977_03360 [Gammaproteobacteria bacterium]|nr:hypothetical protein [Gammaproteobacteria bacterium]MCP5199026.1 hypothetical protein [Gammaproteobacteria bacterium]